MNLRVVGWDYSLNSVAAVEFFIGDYMSYRGTKSGSGLHTPITQTRPNKVCDLSQ